MTSDRSSAGGDVDAGSFRDPSGFVYRRDGRVLRQVNRSFGARWDELAASGLLSDLQDRGILVRHETRAVDDAFSRSEAHAVIEPEQIPLISYPYEWSFSQLKDAALLTLEAQSVAATAGFTMRDASAFNVQFLNGAPILVDTLSFERTVPGRPWIAYRQFCEHFVGPLALMAYRDVRCGLLLRELIEGVPVDLAATLLPGRTKLNVGLASHLHAHASAQRRETRRGGSAPAAPAPRMGDLQQRALLDSLRRTLARLNWDPSKTAWASYADNTSYDPTAEASKDGLVRRYLESAGGRTVWDLGANTGRFSAIAASLGRQVIALDTDAGATELHYRNIRRAGERSILPLLIDLANPSPGLGWANAERRSLLERANADTVLALALVHHLTIGRNVPMPMIADALGDLGAQLIVEFIPESDPMVSTLLTTRTDIRPYPSIESFREVFGGRFEILDDEPIAMSGRRLLRMLRVS